MRNMNIPPSTNTPPPQETEKKSETHEHPPTAHIIFDNVYEQLKNPAFSTQQKHNEWFTSQLEEKTGLHVRAIEQSQTTNIDLFKAVLDKMNAYIKTIQTNDPSRAERKTVQAQKTYALLKNHIHTLVSNKEVEPLTAKVFLTTLLNGSTESFLYNHIVHRQNHNQPTDPRRVEENEKAWEKTVDSITVDHPNSSHSGGFLHVNSDQPHAITTRVYLSAAIDQAPHEMLNNWNQALEHAGLQDRVYFKIPTTLDNRFENIVVYVDDKLDPQSIEELFEKFTTLNKESLMNEETMPTGIPLARGISIASEPQNINTLFKLLGYGTDSKGSAFKKSFSYNSLIARLTQHAFECALYEAQKNNVPHSTPKTLKDDAQRYFDQFLKLSGINPETMIPNAQGGQLPSWAISLQQQAT